MMQKLFWYNYNKGRTKCCHILKAHKLSLMIYNYMDINSQVYIKSHAEFISFLMRFFNEFRVDLYAFSSWFRAVVN